MIVINPTGQRHRQAPVFKIKVNGVAIPGYAQQLDEPGSMDVTDVKISGSEGSRLTQASANSRSLSLNVRYLSRLATGTGMQHLNDCLDQAREALRMLSRTAQPYKLSLGDDSRYLEATLVGWSSPLSTADRRAISVGFNFHTSPWYLGDPVLFATRDFISTARLNGTLFGAPSTATGYFPGTLGYNFNTNAKLATFPAPGSLNLAEGSLAYWMKPNFASTDTPIKTQWTVLDADGSVVLRHRLGMWEVQRGTGSMAIIDPSPVFASGDWLLVVTTWDNVATKIYVVKLGVTPAMTQSTINTAGNAFSETSGPTNIGIGSWPSAETANGIISNLLTFSTALTPDNVMSLAELEEPLECMDEALPPTMLLDARLNGTVVADPQSNSVCLDLGDSRETYATFEFSSALGNQTLTFIGAGKSFVYTGLMTVPVTLDTGTLTIMNINGTNLVKNVSTPDFGMKFDGTERANVIIRPSSSVNVSATMTIQTRHER